MKRFGLVMTDSLYAEFYRTFPDHGQRTNVLRKCVHRMIEQAKVVGSINKDSINSIADGVFKKEIEEGGERDE